MKRIKNILFIILILSVLILFFISVINIYMISFSKKYIVEDKAKVPGVDAIIVLGAYVFPSGEVSWMLRDRLDTALMVHEKVSNKIIVSGDHGNHNYNEVRAMKDHLLSYDVSEDDIFMDHAGFSTYDTMYRAKVVFLVSKAVISTQKYHLYRAIFIARKLGIEAYGIKADLHIYPRMPYYEFREAVARVKDFFYVIFKIEPVFSGPVIDINGSGLQTEG